MPLSQNVYTIGTAATRVVAPTVDSGYYVLKNLEPRPEPEFYAREGRVYDMAQSFQVLRSTSKSFNVLTGSTGAQFEYYQIVTTASSIKAELIEGATPVTTGAAIPAYNVNRNYSDTYNSVFKAVTSYTGGTVVSSEYLTAQKHAGGSFSATKVITLKPNTNYVMKFTEMTGNADPTVYLQIGFSEIYDSYNHIWLGTPNSSFVLRGGEEIKHYLHPYETINATATRAGTRMAVLRQD